MNREDNIKKLAQLWHDSNVRAKVAQRNFDEAHTVLDAARNEREGLRQELGKTVGANITRRCISMQNGTVVIVEYVKDRAPIVSSEELLR